MTIPTTTREELLGLASDLSRLTSYSGVDLGDCRLRNINEKKSRDGAKVVLVSTETLPVIIETLRLAATQPVATAVKVRPLEWEDADEGMCTKWRACALGGHYELVALDGDGGGLAVNFYWGRPLSFWFIQGEPDEWGPTGPKMFPTLDAAKSAAQADYEQRIMAAIEIAPLSDRQPLPGQKQISETGKELPKNTEQPMNNADVSVGELAGFFVTEFPHLLTMSTQIEVARALLARYRIERLDRLASGRR